MFFGLGNTGLAKFVLTWRPSNDYNHLKVNLQVTESTLLVSLSYHTFFLSSLLTFLFLHIFLLNKILIVQPFPISQSSTERTVSIFY